MTAPLQTDVDYLLAVYDHALEDALQLEADADRLEERAYTLRQRSAALRSAHASVTRFYSPPTLRKDP